MAKKVPELQVVLPYKTLMELLEASQAVDELRNENKRLHDLYDGMRGQMLEIMDVIGDLREEIRYL